VGAILVLPLVATCGPAVHPSASITGAPVVHVSGNHLTDAGGATLRLLGVDRSGTEYACIQGWGMFDGPSDAASITAMAAWHINAVRVPLNEDCWLGINGVKAAYGGAAYQQAIGQYVGRVHQAGLVAILDLHWAAPGATPATMQLPLPDADHTPAFWSSVATAYRNDPSVVFDLFNEPYVDTGNANTSDPWSCWLNGCTIKAGNGVASAWQAAGMQSLVDAVRSTGATQPVMAGGLAWSNDLTGWLAHRPNDPSGQLAASYHVYNFNACGTVACWNQQVAPVAAQVPIITGEIGENDCAGGFINQYMAWADGKGISYLGWTWDTWDCRNGPALITDYTGTPTNFGLPFRDHLATLVVTTTVTVPDPITAFPSPTPSPAAFSMPPSTTSAATAAAAAARSTPSAWSTAIGAALSRALSAPVAVVAASIGPGGGWLHHR
jgi:endoglucanase